MSITIYNFNSTRQQSFSPSSSSKHMGQTLISKYQPPPSRQEVDEQMNALLQTVYNCHASISKVTSHQVFDLSLVCHQTAVTLEETVDRLLRQSSDTVDRLYRAAIADPAIAEAVSLIGNCSPSSTAEELPPPPLPPLTTPEDALFTFKCSTCQFRDPASGAIDPGAASFQMALPSQCNHPVCTRCLGSSSTTATFEVVEVYQEGRMTHWLRCPVCGLYSERLLLFDGRSRHLLRRGGQRRGGGNLASSSGPNSMPLIWVSKVATFCLMRCVAHWHRSEEFPSACFIETTEIKASGHESSSSTATGRPRQQLHFLQKPTVEQLTAELAFVVNEWLATAHRHFLEAVGDGGDGSDQQDLATLNTALYLRAVVQSSLRRWCIWKVGLQCRQQQQMNQCEVEEEEEEKEDRCRICLQQRMTEENGEGWWCLVDCCAHLYCSACIEKLQLSGHRLHRTVGDFERCPTCRRPMQKWVHLWNRYYPDGSPAKAALFRQVKCIDEVLEEKKEKEKEIEKK